MDPYADFDCVLDVNVHCDACKMMMMGVLRSIAGVYSVVIDGERKEVMVKGEVDPRILMRALARCGTGSHAKLKYAKVNHPQLRRMNNYYDDTSYNYGNNYYNTIEDPYRNRRSLLGEHSYHDYSYSQNNYSSAERRLHPEYNNYRYYGSGHHQNSYPPPPPAARYAPSYPLVDNGGYEDESISLCSIM